MNSVTFSQLLLIVIVTVPLIFVFMNRLRMDVAALIIAAALGITQFLGLQMLAVAGDPKGAVNAISGFAQPVVLTLISLFILTRGLEKSGVTRWIARKLIEVGGTSEGRLIGLFAATTALLSLFMNNLAAGALLLPSAMEVARRTRIRPSKLLIPIAYGSLLGGAATYFTTANIIVSDLLRIAKPPQQPLGVLDFTPTGGLIAIAGIAFLAYFGMRLLPDHSLSSEQMMARLTGTELEDLYQLGERTWEARILKGSAIAGKRLSETGIGQRLGIEVVALRRGRQSVFPCSPDQMIQTGDVLLLVGREDRVYQLEELGLSIAREEQNGHISPHGVAVFEVILAPRSKAVGQTLKELEFRKRYGFTAIALHRMERSYRTNVGDFKLEMGDSLLVIGPPERAGDLLKNPNFMILQPNRSDQPLDRRQAYLSIGIILAAVLASILGFPVYLSVLVGAVLIVLSGLIDMNEAYQSIEWQAIFLVAGMYTVSLAMVETGLANWLGARMVQLSAPFGALGLAAGAYILCAFLTQFMGGQVSALVAGPIAISAAIGMGVNPQAIAVATAIACSASFLSPLAHPVNILVIAPGNYTFQDFFRIGWRLTIISFVMLLIGMVLFWRL